jgi:anti-anti-sigma factor
MEGAMSDEVNERGGDGTAAPSIELCAGEQSTPGFAAVVRLSGEHDMVMSRELEEALGQITGNALIDLSECSFMDSSIMTVLVVDLRRRQREGHTLEVVVPPKNKTVARALAVSGLDGLITVRPGDGRVASVA